MLRTLLSGVLIRNHPAFEVELAYDFKFVTLAESGIEFTAFSNLRSSPFLSPRSEDEVIPDYIRRGGERRGENRQTTRELRRKEDRHNEGLA